MAEDYGEVNIELRAETLPNGSFSVKMRLTDRLDVYPKILMSQASAEWSGRRDACTASPQKKVNLG